MANEISKIKLTDGTVYNIRDTSALHEVSLSDIKNADDLKAIEALEGTGFLKRTGTNTWSLDGTTYQALIDASNKLDASFLRGTASIDTTGNAATATSATSATNATNATNASKSITQEISDNSTNIATTAFVKAFVDNAISGISGGMQFKGTISSSPLPAQHTAGDVYVVAIAGTYAGQTCEVGDMIICITTGTTSTNSHWSVVQTNIDGAVTGPSSSVDGNIAVYNGATGRVIKDSGILASDLAKASDLPTKSVTLTPSGTISTPTFTGTTATLSHNVTQGSVSASGDYQPAGTISTPTFIGTTATLTLSGSTSGVAVTAHTYQPAGTVSKPSITVSPTTTSIYSITGVGSTPTRKSFTYVSAATSLSVSGEKLVAANGTTASAYSITDVGSVPTRSAVTVMTGATAGLDSAPTFTGTTATLSHSVTQGSVSVSTNYQPSGTVSKPTFTGTTATINVSGSTSGVAVTAHTYQPAGTVSQPTFTGTSITHNHINE